ncbi:MAG: DUF4430 domain-containing protein [Enterococcus sp.]
MKKKLVVTMALLGMVTLAGCQNQSTTSTEETEVSSSEVSQEATITITEDDEEIVSKDVSFTEEESLMDVMKENFEIEEKDGFITAIDGHEQNESESKYWTFTINDEMATKGAADLSLTANDQVDFDLAVFE